MEENASTCDHDTSGHSWGNSAVPQYRKLMSNVVIRPSSLLEHHEDEVVAIGPTAKEAASAEDLVRKRTAQARSNSPPPLPQERLTSSAGLVWRWRMWLWWMGGRVGRWMRLGRAVTRIVDLPNRFRPHLLFPDCPLSACRRAALRQHPSMANVTRQRMVSARGRNEDCCCGDDVFDLLSSRRIRIGRMHDRGSLQVSQTRSACQADWS